MESLVNGLEGIPLSGCDLVAMATKLGNPHTRYIDEYDTLKDIKSLEELFADANSVFILLDIFSDREPMAHIGHWVVLCLGDRAIQFFDPYGNSLERDLELTGEEPYLQKLLYGYKVEENKHKLQKFNDDVNTCGRHDVVRALFHFLSNDEYYDRVINPVLKQRLVKSPDVLVTLLTAFLGCESDKGDQRVMNFFRTNFE